MIVFDLLTTEFILNKPFIKLTYSRYNNKNLLQKTFIFFQKRTNLDQNKITMEQEVNANQRVLLVDDSLGSGGLIDQRFFKILLLLGIEIVLVFGDLRSNVSASRRDGPSSSAPGV